LFYHRHHVLFPWRHGQRPGVRHGYRRHMAQRHLVPIVWNGNVVEQAGMCPTRADLAEFRLERFHALAHSVFSVFFDVIDHDCQPSTIVPISLPQTTSTSAPGWVTSKTMMGIE